MENKVKVLKNKLKNLAEHHAFVCSKNKENNTPNECKFSLEKVSEVAINLDFFKAFDKADLQQKIKDLETSVNHLLGLSTLSQSRYNGQLMPVAFDALIDIFTLLDKKLLQQYFQELTEIFYQELCISFQKHGSTEILDKTNYNNQVKVLLPLVKMLVLLQVLENNVSHININELLANISSYLKFPRINQEDIYIVIKNKINSSSFNLQSYEFIPLDAKNGHLGEYFTLKILVSIEDNVQQFYLFAKFLTPKTEGMKQLVLSGPSKKEEFFYMTYIPLLEKYGLKSLLDFAPNCYFSRINDVLILDDLVANGYTGLTPNTQLQYNALHEVVQKMAKFHASSMILEEILSKKDGKKISLNDLFEEYFKEVLFVIAEDHFLNASFKIALSTIEYLTSKFPEITNKFSENYLAEKIDKGWKLHFKQVQKSQTFKNTICHGDMHVSNILFKWNTENICQDIRLIDFQLLRYCPATHDLLFFLHQTCTKEVRDQHLRQLCDEYYEALTYHLKIFGFDIEKVYPKENFERSLKYMKSQAVFHALYYSPVTMISPELREKIFSDQEKANYYLDKHRSELVDIGLEEDNYKTVLKGLIEDFVELCESGDL